MHLEERLWVHQHHLHRRKDAVQQPLPPSLLSGFAIVSFNQIQFNINNLLRYQKWLDYHGRLYWTQSFEIGYLEPNAVQQPPPYYKVLQLLRLIKCSSTTLSDSKIDWIITEDHTDHYVLRTIFWPKNIVQQPFNRVLAPLDCHQVLQLIIA